MSKTITLNAEDLKNLAKENQQPFEIISASLKDMQCNYGYEIVAGSGVGDIIPNRKGAHFIHEDLQEAFSNMDVFLAHIDGAFNAKANNQTHLSELEESEELAQFYVSSVKIVGVEENKSVIIGGTKHTVHGYISFTTPKIKLNGTYLYLEELEQRLWVLLDEVYAYMEGKKAPELEQTLMDFDSFEEENDAFERAKVE